VVIDTISDILTRIRNATLVRHKTVIIPITKMSLAITTILKIEGFINDFKFYKEGKKNYLLLSLKYNKSDKTSVITGIKRISKPGLRIYIKLKDLPPILDNFGISILSTSKGVITNVKAKEFGVGGEVLCYIW